MAKRSLQASPAGIQQIKRAFARKAWTQESLAEEVNLKTRQPIWRLFTGQPIDRHVFMEICSILDLNWREMAIDPPAEFPELGAQLPLLNPNINALVKQVRSRRFDKVQDQCGVLQLLDISYPVNLDDMYVDVNVLEAIASKQHLEIADLQRPELAAFEPVGLGEIEQTQISGMQAVETYPKLRVLGKPGVGKTTFLQHLAIQCHQGVFAPMRVPVFITLRHFVEESRVSDELSLFNYIRQEFLRDGITDHSAIETLLQAGRVLLLLDGIDEVPQPESIAVLREIRRFSDKYHKNRFVTTCRTAAQNFSMRGFTDVEIAPFTPVQIMAFAQKWFIAFTRTTTQAGRAQSAQFIRQLDLPENRQFRQLVVTPLFLHMACRVFQGQGRFPSQRTEFYKQGVELLLGKWDEAKGVEREPVYRGLSLPQTLKLLSQIAAVTFEQGQYFFEQRVVEQHIEDYLRHLPNASTDGEALQLESEAVLKALESQHGLLTQRARGIFSFSHLAFQEYFTARNIVTNYNLQAPEQALGRLVSHLSDPHWREIFLLTATMLRNADSLVQLMKQQIDALVADDPYLQEFLLGIRQKSPTVPVEIKDAKVKALSLALAHTPHRESDSILAHTLDQGMFLDGTLSQTLGIVLGVGCHKSWQPLPEQFLPPAQNQVGFGTWWQAHHDNWAEQLKTAIAYYRQIHHHWQFSPEQQQTLQRYYAANQLLLDCLHSNYQVTATIRQEIEATLLLPPIVGEAGEQSMKETGIG